MLVPSWKYLFETLVVLLVFRYDLASSDAPHHQDDPPASSFSSDLIGLLHAGDSSFKDKVKRGWKDNTMQVWGKRKDPLGRGKPTPLRDTTSDRKDTIQESKLDPIPRPSERKWDDSSLQVWGKRDAGESEEKRRWAENSMQVWGKRDNQSGTLRENNDTKRKWSENGMAVWGKRDGEEKRKWSENEVRVWGKRNDLQDTETSERRKRSVDQEVDPDWIELFKRHRSRWNGVEFDGPKRNWETNKMAVWGKRSHPSDGQRLAGAMEDLETLRLERQKQEEERRSWSVKRAWSSDNGLGIWGKRASTDDLEEWTV